MGGPVPPQPPQFRPPCYKNSTLESSRVDGTGGAEGAQAPPSFLDLCSKNYKISQIREENSFFYLVVPPHKKFASVHPDGILIHLVVE